MRSEKKPFFSVVVPLYNKKPHIKRSVSSVLIQTFEDFELIVVDDGSTDASLDELKDIKDNRLKIFEKENGGASSARNFGIKQAKADYVAFLDADDEWNEAFLETIVEMYDLFPDKGMYATACELVDNFSESTIVIKNKEIIFKIEDYFKEFVKLGAPVSNSSSTVVKKELLIAVGLFPEYLTNFEDWNVWFKVALLSDTVYTQRILSSIHLDAENRSNQYTSKKPIDLLKEYDKLIIDIERFINKHKTNRQSIDIVFERKAQGFINGAIKDRKWNFLEVFKDSELYKYTNNYQRIVYMSNINKLVLVAYKILNIIGVKK